MSIPTLRTRLALLVLVAAASVLSGTAGAAESADLVLRNGRIYTALPGAAPAQAIAVRGERIVFVGTNAGASAYVGPKTVVTNLKGAFVLPGLVDSHIHPLDIVDLDNCDLDSKSVTLRQLSEFVKGCIAKFKPAPGAQVLVHQWNYAGGNEPDADYPTIRVALDKASTTHLVQLLGNDGHHGGFNSLALASAKDDTGRTVGISKATLGKELADYRKVIGVDATGEPNGAVNEDGRLLINPRSMLNTDLEDVLKAPQKVTERLNSVGITAFMDAMAGVDSQQVYDALEKSGRLSARVRLAQFWDLERVRTPDGKVDVDAVITRAKAFRDKYATDPLIRADFVKLFADGVTEGNPLAVPPTLPNAASLTPFLQPVFALDAKGRPTVTGYVDTASATCREVRADAAKYEQADAAAAFLKTHGYHPGQCTISDGQLQHPREVQMEFVRKAHLAGFNVHIHAIGDRGLRTALDAIEAARRADGISTTRDSLAHLQITTPEDVRRVGEQKLFVAFTYAWMNVSEEYDITAIPFFVKVRGNSDAALHPPGSRYDRDAYPVRSVRDAGGILVGGSDAPVETRDPRPFLNIARAVTRRMPGQPALNPRQSVGIEDAIAAYTINGARHLGIDRDAGSLEAGKSADFVVVDRDLLALAKAGRADDIAGTRVRETWFRGARVYAASGR
jgi:predicted amidohydrolase YtcJ